MNGFPHKNCVRKNGKILRIILLKSEGAMAPVAPPVPTPMSMALRIDVLFIHKSLARLAVLQPPLIPPYLQTSSLCERQPPENRAPPPPADRSQSCSVWVV